MQKHQFVMEEGNMSEMGRNSSSMLEYKLFNSLEKVNLSDLLTFLDKNALTKSNLKVCKTDNSGLWLETSDNFVSVKLVVEGDTRMILYDIFSPKYDVHLKEETLKDVEKLDSIAEVTRKWRYEESIEDLWVILDWIKLWARKNNFKIERAHLI